MTSTSVPITAILAHTPFWVWAVLLLLIWRGLSAARDRDVSARRLVILPLVIVCLALSGLADTPPSLLGVGAVAIGIVAGIAAGLVRFRVTGAQQLAPGIVRLHGEWVTMFVVLAIFLLHYVTGVLAAIDAPLAQTPVYQMGMGGASALLSAMTVTVAVLRIRLAYRPIERAGTELA